LIDHTLLRPEATAQEVEQLCQEAQQYGFGCVFTHSIYVPLAASILSGSGVRIGSVAGFPLGAVETQVKVAEAEVVLAGGGLEVDMVVQIGYLKGGELRKFREDIESVVKVVRQKEGARVKAILEVGLLTPEEVKKACELAVEAGVDFVKSCTGFGPRGVEVEDIRLLKDAVKGRAKIKASGGIRSLSQALLLLQAGADRLGTSASVNLIEEALRIGTF
jgi:deoxyribose-phosphate aldolase